MFKKKGKGQVLIVRKSVQCPDDILDEEKAAGLDDELGLEDVLANKVRLFDFFFQKLQRLQIKYLSYIYIRM